MSELRGVARRVLGVVCASALLAMTGCAGFFTDPTTTTTTTTTTNSGDYVYVVNQSTDTLSAFSVGSSTLTAISGSPYGLLSGLSPSSVEVSRANTFVYVGGAGAIECFSVSASGALTLVASQAATAAARFVSLATSPDGKWLIALDSLSQSLYVFGINTSTGALTLNAQVAYSIAAGVGTVVPNTVRVAPDGAYLIASLGTGGDVVFTFNTATGAPSFSGALAVPSGDSDNSVAIDANSSYVYLARGGTNTGTSGVASFRLGSGGTLTAVQTLETSGNTPFSLVLDSTGAYAYTANRGDGTVSGFTVQSGTLTPLSGSPYAAGTLATALARDNSGKYLVAASFGGGSDLTMYSFDTSTAGKLDMVATAASGTDPAGAIALAATH